MSLLQAGFGSSGDDYEITDSLRLRSSASAYLSRTPSSTSDRTEWTWSGWVKKGPNATNLSLFSADHAGGSNAYLSMLINNSDEFQIFEYTGSAYTLRLATNALFRDPSAWYHFVCAVDTDQGTDTNRIKLYVNGVQQTSLRLSTYPSSGHTTYVNVSGNLHAVGATVGASTSPDRYLDGYLTEVNFIDGQQLTPSDFGEFDDNGTWKPLAYTGAYGTNGFYLPMKPTTQATGFNTVIFEGNDAVLSVDGVGFSPDFVWLKDRDTTGYGHQLFDTVRGVTKYVSSNGTGAEGTSTGVTSFDADGFTLGSSGFVNRNSIVAWCWDAGSGSAGTNTAGSINSTVKANPATGFSIVSYTGNGTSAGARTVGHGLGVTPSMVIVKSRGAVRGWETWFNGFSSSEYIFLNTTGAKASFSNSWGSTPTSTVFGVNNSTNSNNASEAYIAYCFAEVAGYSKIATYSGNGSTTGPVVTTGFRPAWIMTKAATGTGGWHITDTTRYPQNDTSTAMGWLDADTNTAEGDYRTYKVTDTGFQVLDNGSVVNGNGVTYIYMAFADTADARFNFDASGNQNNWEPNNINSNAESETTYDLMKDTPSLVDENAGNFAVMNPIDKNDGSYTDGNLGIVTGTVGGSTQRASMYFNSGKYYWEYTPISNGGISAPGFETLNSGTFTPQFYQADNGQYYNGSSASSYGATFGNNDVIGIAVDVDNRTVQFFKNGASQGTISSSNSGISVGDSIIPYVTDRNVGQTTTAAINFGQRPFKYTPPTGFLKLNTFNLPDSAIEKGSDHMTPLLYSGNNSTQSITGADFQPALTITKDRFHVTHVTAVDAVRGAPLDLFLSSTNGDSNDHNGITAFTSGGFNLGSSTNHNVTGHSYATHNWKAGTSFSNSAGSNNATIASSGQSDTTAGFSIVSYTGTGSAGTVNHNLTSAPEIIIVKDRARATEWPVMAQHANDGNGHLGWLRFGTYAWGATSILWNNTAPTSSVFSIGTYDYVNFNNSTYIAWCWHSVPGYSSISSYIGNGSTDGPFIHTGFAPQWIMAKVATSQINATNWQVYDTTRNPNNVIPDYHFIDTYVVESNSASTYFNADILSNGFKIRGGNTYGMNQSGAKYIYMAFAENPFKNSNAR